jgi:small subunit ribosomal protein S6
MRTYEYLVLLKPDLNDEQLGAAVGKLRSVIDSRGRVFAIDFWGKKKLAYEVKKYAKGFYVRFVLAAPPDHLEEIERVTRIHADVMKFLAVKLDDTADIAKLEEQYGPEPVFELKTGDEPKSVEGEAKETAEKPAAPADAAPAEKAAAPAAAEDDEKED